MTHSFTMVAKSACPITICNSEINDPSTLMFVAEFLTVNHLLRLTHISHVLFSGKQRIVGIR